MVALRKCKARVIAKAAERGKADGQATTARG
jgi:hypothetical protein